LPRVHAGQPILAVRGRWADLRLAGNAGVNVARRALERMAAIIVWP
jgi:hypothetical protein